MVARAPDPPRVARLLRMVRGEPVSTFSGTQGFEEFSARVEPHSPGLADRIWYGAGSRRSTQWAAEQGLNLLTSNIIKPEPSDLETDGRWDFAAIQQRQIALWPTSRRAPRARPRQWVRRGRACSRRPTSWAPPTRSPRGCTPALPFTFEHEDDVQILTDTATKLGPALGWSPRQTSATRSRRRTRRSASAVL